MFLDLISMSTAEYKDFLDSSFDEEFNGIVQKWNIHQWQQGLCMESSGLIIKKRCTTENMIVKELCNTGFVHVHHNYNIKFVQ